MSKFQVSWQKEVFTDNGGSYWDDDFEWYDTVEKAEDRAAWLASRLSEHTRSTLQNIAVHMLVPHDVSDLVAVTRAAAVAEWQREQAEAVAERAKWCEVNERAEYAKLKAKFEGHVDPRSLDTCPCLPDASTGECQVCGWVQK